MSSPIKTRVDELPSSILLPNCMWEYLAQVANEDLQPERSPDPYAPWKAKEKFAEGRMPPDAYLQQVRLQTEAKVCTKNHAGTNVGADSGFPIKQQQLGIRQEEPHDGLLQTACVGDASHDLELGMAAAPRP